MRKFQNDQSGTIQVVFFLIAIVGLLFFLLAAAIFPFKGIFGDLFKKNESQAATVPTNFQETQIVSGLTNPTAMVFASDGRLFVTQQGGALRVVKNGSLLATPFITLTVDSNGERGLLGIAFDPQFATNNFIYLYYTTPTPAVHNRLSRFTANGDVVLAGSEMVLLDIDNLSAATNHNGGPIHFGQDGKIYIGVGENANGSNSQTVNNLLGKILRIYSDGTIPSDNPTSFVVSDGSTQTPTGKNKAIYALGFRNPYTFDIQPGTGRIFINDVGESGTARREEINDLIKGKNYGWPTCQGTLVYGTSTACSTILFINPLYNYPQGSDGNCAIVGGTFYNPTVQQFPSQYNGSYFFSDLCAGWIKQFNPATSVVTDFTSGISQPVDLKVGPEGALYYLARGSGSVVKITSTSSPTPQPTPIPGDIDGNGKVDIFDYNILVTNFAKSGTGIQGDLDNNGTVNIFDYNILVTNFGKSI